MLATFFPRTTAGSDQFTVLSEALVSSHYFYMTAVSQELSDYLCTLSHLHFDVARHRYLFEGR